MEVIVVPIVRNVLIGTIMALIGIICAIGVNEMIAIGCGMVVMLLMLIKMIVL